MHLKGDFHIFTIEALVSLGVSLAGLRISQVVACCFH